MMRALLNRLVLLCVVVAASHAFECDNGRRKIHDTWINDDYCDCDDGTDEPATSACAHVEGQQFTCRKGPKHFARAGIRSGGASVASSVVGDGVCDCCDGSDEPSGCKNTCGSVGKGQLCLLDRYRQHWAFPSLRAGRAARDKGRAELNTWSREVLVSAQLEEAWGVLESRVGARLEVEKTLETTDGRELANSRVSSAVPQSALPASQLTRLEAMRRRGMHRGSLGGEVDREFGCAAISDGDKEHVATDIYAAVAVHGLLSCPLEGVGYEMRLGELLDLVPGHADVLSFPDYVEQQNARQELRAATIAAISSESGMQAKVDVMASGAQEDSEKRSDGGVQLSDGGGGGYDDDDDAHPSKHSNDDAHPSKHSNDDAHPSKHSGSTASPPSLDEYERRWRSVQPDTASRLAAGAIAFGKRRIQASDSAPTEVAPGVILKVAGESLGAEAKMSRRDRKRAGIFGAVFNPGRGRAGWLGFDWGLLGARALQLVGVGLVPVRAMYEAGAWALERLVGGERLEMWQSTFNRVWDIRMFREVRRYWRRFGLQWAFEVMWEVGPAMWRVLFPPIDSSYRRPEVSALQDALDVISRKKRDAIKRRETLWTKINHVSDISGISNLKDLIQNQSLSVSDDVAAAVAVLNGYEDRPCVEASHGGYRYSWCPGKRVEQNSQSLGDFERLENSSISPSFGIPGGLAAPWIYHSLWNNVNESTQAALAIAETLGLPIQQNNLPQCVPNPFESQTDAKWAAMLTAVMDPHPRQVHAHLHGWTCPGHGPRSAQVHVVCGPSFELVHAEEPQTCAYALLVTHPAVCTDKVLRAVNIAKRILE